MEMIVGGVVAGAAALIAEGVIASERGESRHCSGQSIV
jgi:hypothetical protein